IYLQARLIGKAGGASDSDVDKGETINRRIFELLKRGAPGPELDKKLEALVEEIKSGLPDAERKKVEAAGSLSPAAMKSLTSPWFRYFLSLDPRAALRKVKCPVL